MQDRRTFLQQALSGVLVYCAGGPAFAASSTQRAIVFDAMGELRNVYSAELLQEILDSGLNAITVTLCDPKSFERQALDWAMAGIREYDDYIAANPNQLVKATSIADLDAARRDGKLAVFYLVQNSSPFGRDLGLVDTFYGLGLRTVQITYNYQNWAGAGCKERTGAGLTEFGLELVAKLNDKDILIDASHANMKTMADCITASRAPIIVSHTGCMAIHVNVRNTTDENLRLLADHGGVVGIDQIRPHITTLTEGALDPYLDHLLHAVNVCGIDHVGIGSDRDHRYIELTPEYLAELRAEQGANLVESDLPWFMPQLNGPRRMETVWDGLKGRGLSDDDVEKVVGGNVYRIYGEVIG